MRIVIHDYAGHPFPVQLSRELAWRGHQVTHAYAGGLLTPRGVLTQQADDPAGFRCVEIPMSPSYRVNKYSFIKRLGYERDYGRELGKAIGILRPDLILSGQTPSDPQLSLIRAAATLGIPVITWVQDFYSLAVDKLARRKLPVIGSLAGWWYRRLDAQCLRRSAAIVAITEDFKPILRQFGVPDRRITVIPNWGPLAELPLRARDNPWAVLHGLAGKFVFLYSGTLAMKHDPELLVRLARHFRPDPSVQVVVISEGPGAEYLAGYKAGTKDADNLLLLPFSPFSGLPDILASADVLLAVLESDAGVFSVPSKVLTYHTARRPILAAIPAGNLAARIIHGEESGLCVEPQDAAGFIAAAEKLRADANLRQRLADNGRTYAEREFDIERIAGRFEAVFQAVLVGKQPAAAD
jgi:colanic acid biosynthesis glycosyl transferase WcaI